MADTKVLLNTGRTGQLATRREVWERAYGDDIRDLRDRLDSGDIDFAAFEMVEGR